MQLSKVSIVYGMGIFLTVIILGLQIIESLIYGRFLGLIGSIIFMVIGFLIFKFKYKKCSNIENN